MRRPKVARKQVGPIALVTVVVGVLLIAVSTPDPSSRVIAHENISFGEVVDMWTPREPVVIGPYHLENAPYSLWIEDIYTDLDDDMFDVEAYASDGTFDSGYTDENVTRTIDGVDCEITAVYDDLTEDDWTFVIHVFDNSIEEPVHVFIVRELDYTNAITFASGVVCLTLGSVLALLVLRERSKETGTHEGLPPHHHQGDE